MIYRLSFGLKPWPRESIATNKCSSFFSWFDSDDDNSQANFALTTKIKSFWNCSRKMFTLMGSSGRASIYIFRMYTILNQNHVFCSRYCFFHFALPILVTDFKLLRAYCISWALSTVNNGRYWKFCTPHTYKIHWFIVPSERSGMLFFWFFFCLCLKIESIRIKRERIITS